MQLVLLVLIVFEVIINTAFVQQMDVMNHIISGKTKYQLIMISPFITESVLKIMMNVFVM